MKNFVRILPAYCQGFYLYLFVLNCLSAQVSYGQATIIRWPFGTTGTAPNYSLGDPNVTGTNALFVNAGATTTLTASRYQCTQWTDAALNPARYLEVTVTPNANYNVTIQQIAANLDRTATGPLNYEIRISDTNFSTFTTFTTGAVPSAATSYTLSGTSTIVRNTNTVKVRFYFWGATATSGVVSTGGISLLGSVQRPTVTATPTALSGFNTPEGTPSAVQSYVVSASALAATDPATLTAPNGYEISTSAGSGFGSSTTLTQTSGGVIAATTIYVRLKGITQGTFSGNVTNAATGAIVANVALSGTVTAPLPVELTGFSAKAVGNTVQLSWTTAWERNADHYVVQRRDLSGEFSNAGEQQAVGNSVARNSYTLTDAAPNEGLNYYRLAQVDLDGRIAYSKLVTATVKADKPDVSLLTNPSDGRTVALQLHGVNSPSVQLYTLVGQALPGRLQQQSATNAAFLPDAPLSPGLYILVIGEESFRKALNVLVE